MHRVVLEAAGDVEAGGVALHGGAQGKDDFFDVATGHSFYQAVNLEVLGAHAVHRTDKSAQHMIESIVLLGALDGHDVADVLYHADGGAVAPGVGADVTHIGIADVVTHLAVFHFALELDDGIAKGFDGGSVLAEQMQHQAHGGLAAYTRQFGKLADGFL